MFRGIKTIKLAVLLLFLLSILATSSAIIYAEESCTEELEVHFFYSKTCPHCKNEIEYLHQLEEQYPEIKIHYLESAVNTEELSKFAEQYNTKTSGVPRTFVGDKVFIGFSKDKGKLEYSQSYEAYIGYQNQIESAILENFNITNPNKDIDLNELITNFNPILILLIIPLYLLSYFILHKKLKKTQLKRYWVSGLIAISILSIFLVVVFTPEVMIKDFAASLPFPLFVFIVALADGFNPCAFTVLIILLSLLTYTKDKKSMTILGLTFIITSALMYFIFIMFMILVGSWAIQQYGPTIMEILGIAILFAGMINLKDFFFFKKGISLSISDKQKTKVTHKATKIMKSLKESKTFGTFFLAMLSTIVLAVFVNIVELGCTAILPAIYMVSLVNSFGEVVGFAHILWTLFYSIIYILPLFAILFNFMYTFKSTRLTERHGRILKLVSGLFMLAFGLMMIFKPELLMFA